jgi:hypothetical protein
MSELRKNWYAELFQTLGHLIHLVQDAAVPSHTRNDSHLVVPDDVPVFGGLKIDADPFHYWADSPLGLNRINSVAQAQHFDPSILNQGSPNPLAPVPVARIIDKTDGDFGVLSPNLNIGLAEYSNANFISKGTARSTSYQYPTFLQLEFPLDFSAAGKKRRYARFRQGFGEQDYWVGVSSRMAQFVNSTVPPDAIDFGLDDTVHADYGRKLFPRAIGYSAGLIDYFFRGRLEPFNPEHPFGSICPNSPEAQSDCPTAQITVAGGFRNITPAESIQGPGEMRAVFRTGEGPGGQQVIHVSDAVTVNLTEQFPEDPSTGNLTFFFLSDPFPADNSKWPCTVVGTTVPCNVEFVYRGPLGKENDAVIAVRAPVDID